jgi:strictosidine synthase
MKLRLFIVYLIGTFFVLGSTADIVSIELPSSKISVLVREKVEGAEDLTIYKSLIYFGTKKGELYRLNPVTNKLVKLYQYNGRPLGIEVLNEFQIYIADAKLGLVEVNLKTGKHRVLMNEIDNRKIGFCDDLVLVGEYIYFTDASGKRGLDNAEDAVILGKKNGRLIRYHRASGKGKVILDHLAFPNGITYNDKKNELYFTETATYRLLKLSLCNEDESAPVPEVLMDNLPGFPDNLTFDKESGSVWVAFFAPRKKILDIIRPFPFLTSLMTMIPKFFRPRPVRQISYLHIGPMGVEYYFNNDVGFHPVTSVIKHSDGKLYLGSLTDKGIAVISRRGSKK